MILLWLIPLIMVCLTFTTLLIIYIINTKTFNGEFQINSHKKEKHKYDK